MFLLAWIALHPIHRETRYPCISRAYDRSLQRRRTFRIRGHLEDDGE